jgi:hypothetical protein
MGNVVRVMKGRMEGMRGCQGILGCTRHGMDLELSGIATGESYSRWWTRAFFSVDKIRIEHVTSRMKCISFR